MERKVVESATEARQGRSGRPILVVLISALALALVAWVGLEVWGEATDPPAEQTATPPAGSNTPAAPSQSTTPPVPAQTDRTPHATGGTGGDMQTNEPSGSTTKQ